LDKLIIAYDLTSEIMMQFYMTVYLGSIKLNKYDDDDGDDKRVCCAR